VTTLHNPIQHDNDNITTIPCILNKNGTKVKQIAIDISKTHEDFLQDKNFPATYGEVLSPIIDKIKQADAHRHTTEHHLFYDPFSVLLNYAIDDNDIIELSKLDYNWEKYYYHILCDAIFGYSYAVYKDRIRVLVDYFALNEKCTLNCFLEESDGMSHIKYGSDNNIEDFLERLPDLINLGFRFTGEKFISQYFDYVIENLDESCIQHLIDSGFDLEASIKSFPSEIASMNAKGVQKLLQFYPKPEEIADLLLKSDPKFQIYKLLAQTYGVDFMNILV
jgi:hypothetical protein